MRHIKGSYIPPGGGSERAIDVAMAKTFIERLIGLMGEREFVHGDALALRPCSSVHTFFMRMNMDLAFLNREGKVIATYASIRPWRMRACWGADTALEFPAGRLSELGIEVGGIFRW